MKHFSTLVPLLIMVAAFDPVRPAYAYLDPGTGSMLLQIILGGVAGALVILKLYGHRFKSYLNFKSSGQSKGAATTGEDNEADK